MNMLTKEQRADLYKREEYNPKGCGALICTLSAIILAFVLLLLLSSCEKINDNQDVDINGNCSGAMSYRFNATPVQYAVNRSIRGDSSTWYTSPPVVSKCIPSVNRYPITYLIDKRNTSCSGHRSLLIFSGSGIIRNDSLFESGTYDYKYFFNDILTDHVTGSWSAWFARTEIWKPIK